MEIKNGFRWRGSKPAFFLDQKRAVRQQKKVMGTDRKKRGFWLYRFFFVLSACKRSSVAQRREQWNPPVSENFLPPPTPGVDDGLSVYQRLGVWGSGF